MNHHEDTTNTHRGALAALAAALFLADMKQTPNTDNTDHGSNTSE